MQQRTKKSSYFQMTKCGDAKNEVQQRTKKSSYFQMTKCGEAKNEVQQRTKNLVILKKQTVDKRNRSAATHQII